LYSSQVRSWWIDTADAPIIPVADTINQSPNPLLAYAPNAVTLQLINMLNPKVEVQFSARPINPATNQDIFLVSPPPNARIIDTLGGYALAPVQLPPEYSSMRNLRVELAQARQQAGVVVQMITLYRVVRVSGRG
jgi:hypothetical protein